MHIEHELRIAAPIDALWALTTGIERWPQLFPTVTAVELLDDGPLRSGSRARLRQPGQRPRVWTVTELDAPHRFVWTAPIGRAVMTATHELRADGARACVNRLVIDVAGPGSTLMARLLGRRIASVLATENAGFARAATAERSTT